MFFLDDVQNNISIKKLEREHIKMIETRRNR